MNKLYIMVFILLSAKNISAQVSGCTDLLATNFNSIATINDGSCTYSDASISSQTTFNLPPSVSETSGLIYWNNSLWTHNDSGTDINLYALNPADGSIIKSYPLTGYINNDWEEISQDETYIYIGDFGNNANGNRTDLKILRIEKNSLLLNSPLIDVIYFSYSNQTDFTPTGSNNTDFDCEAFIVTSTNIYLFTKQYISNKTSVYSLPKTPGTYSANLENTYNVAGLITGSVYLKQKKLIALCGYSNTLQPFFYLLYDFPGTNFFGGNKRKINMNLPFHQIEGITTVDGLNYYLTNEFISRFGTTIPQKLHTFDLSSFLSNYLTNLPLGVNDFEVQNKIVVFPNPVSKTVFVKSSYLPTTYNLTNSVGKRVKTGILTSQNSSFNMVGLEKGVYFLNLSEKKQVNLKLIKH